MERLTVKLNDGGYGYAIANNTGVSNIALAIDHLAAYEDTGLTPEEIERIHSEYGRGMTLRTSNAERLRIIKDIPTEELRKCVEKWRGLHEAD